MIRIVKKKSKQENTSAERGVILSQKKSDPIQQKLNLYHQLESIKIGINNVIPHWSQFNNEKLT